MQANLRNCEYYRQFNYDFNITNYLYVLNELLVIWNTAAMSHTIFVTAMKLSCSLERAISSETFALKREECTGGEYSEDRVTLFFLAGEFEELLIVA